MKYLWEVMLKAKEEGIATNDIQFLHAANASAYMEISLPYLNQDIIGDQKKIEVNTFYRFYEIFKNMFVPEQKEFPDLRRGMTNLLLHMIAQNDVCMGMTKEEFYKKLLVLDIRNEVFDKTAIQIFEGMQKEEQGKLLSGWLRSYRVGSSLAIFIDMIHELIEDSIVYHNNDCPDEVLIYTRLKKTYELEQKIQFLIELFLEIRYHVKIFYENHFAIIGLEETMIIDEAAIY